MYLCAPWHAWCHGDQRRVSDPLELELKTIVSCPVGTGRLGCRTKGEVSGKKGNEVQSIYSLGDQFLKTARSAACCSDSTDKGQWELEGEIFWGDRGRYLSGRIKCAETAETSQAVFRRQFDRSALRRKLESGAGKEG